jgi:hypothetical protein
LDDLHQHLDDLVKQWYVLKIVVGVVVVVFIVFIVVNVEFFFVF